MRCWCTWFERFELNASVIRSFIFGEFNSKWCLVLSIYFCCEFCEWKMSCYFKHQQETTINIPSNVDINGGSFKWIHFTHIAKWIQSEIYWYSMEKNSFQLQEQRITTFTCPSARWIGRCVIDIRSLLNCIPNLWMDRVLAEIYYHPKRY